MQAAILPPEQLCKFLHQYDEGNSGTPFETPKSLMAIPTEAFASFPCNTTRSWVIYRKPQRL